MVVTLLCTAVCTRILEGICDPHLECQLPEIGKDMEQHDGEHAEQVHPLHQAPHAQSHHQANKNDQLHEKIHLEKTGVRT